MTNKKITINKQINRKHAKIKTNKHEIIKKNKKIINHYQIKQK